MTTLPLENVSRAASAESSRRTYYIPERLTPLAFTGIYAELSDAHRTRYNQLSGLYFLEQTIFFEQCMGRPVLEWLEMNGLTSLRDDAREFIEEENRHTSWFRQLLRDCEPRWYAKDCFRLVKAGSASRTALNFCAQRPHRFPCLLWLQIMAEERAQYFSAAFVADANELDPRFVEVQHRHLADEGGHIRWDVEFIEWLWPATPSFLRKMNARLLEWLLHEFFHLPKRSGWNVIEHLVAEFPELSVRKSDLRAAMRSLAQNDTYLRTLYPRCVFPRTRRLANRWPELHFLEGFFTE